MDDISKINDANWDLGKQRVDIIHPLAENSICTKKMILEAKLARYGYNVPALCEVFNARPSEVKAYLLGQLNSNKLPEFNKEIYKLGVI